MEENRNKLKDRRKSILLFLLLFFVFALSSILLGIVCLDGIQASFFKKYFRLIALLYSVCICALFGIAVWLTITQKTVWQKTILSLFILLLFALTVCFILQETGFFNVVNTPESLRQYLEKTGAWMPIAYTFLQFLQVVLLPIPSVVSTLVGVALFGAFWATIYSLIGSLFGSISAFFIGRRFGYKAVGWMVGEETLVKWQKKLKGKDNLFLTLAFILPLFPDDILCFVAGLSTMSIRYFFIIILLSRAIGITATCYSIDLIPFNTWWGIALWMLFLLLVVLTFIVLYKNMDKIQAKIKRLRKKKGDK